MPKYIGGDILELSASHPTLGDFRFQAKANETFNLEPGGIRTSDDSNGITGSGIMIQQMNRIRWAMDGPIAVDLASEYELKALNKMSESPELANWTVSHISGAIYRGQGKPVGEFSIDTNTAQLTLKVAGSGKMEKIS